MKAEVIMNGTLKIVLSGETDLERMALKEMCKMETETVEITQKTQILDHIINDGMFIKTKKKESQE